MSAQFAGEMPEVFPTVVIDADYGQHVNDVSVDIPALTEHLRAGGLSDEDIMATSVHIGARRDVNAAGTVTAGRYNHRTRTTRVMPEVSAADVFKTDPVDQENFRTNVEKSLIHELEHARSRHNPEMRRKNAWYHTKEAIRLLAGLATTAGVSYGAYEVMEATGMDENTAGYVGLGAFFLGVTMYMTHKISGNGAFKTYMRRPEEQHCREFEEIYTGRFIDFEWKSDDGKAGAKDAAADSFRGST